MNAPRALVLRAPGINCERETAQACRLVGFATDLLHINALLKAPEHLLDYDFLVIPGGFSYGDDLGAGTLLAKNLTIHLGQGGGSHDESGTYTPLRQFVDQGRPILGICNGFQVLVRAGLLPGHLVPAPLAPARGASTLPSKADRGDTSHDILSASLTENASAQFECRWVTLAIQPGPCIFTKGIAHPIELPIAHGEGRFVLADAAMLSLLQAQGQIPLVYIEPNARLQGPNGHTCPPDRVPQGSPPRATTRVPTPHRTTPAPTDALASTPASLQQEVSYPYNPNGSIGNVAGICNAQGNVFGLMPHPERYVHALQHPQRRSTQNAHDGQGDGLLIFANAFDYAKTLQLYVRSRIGE